MVTIIMFSWQNAKQCRRRTLITKVSRPELIEEPFNTLNQDDLTDERVKVHSDIKERRSRLTWCTGARNQH